MKYTPRKFFDYNLTSEAVTAAKVGKKLVTTDSGDPAASNDTGEGYIVGSMWINTTSGEQFICTNITAEDATWKGQVGENINLFTMQGNTGYVHGGSPNKDNIHRFSFTSPHDSVEHGEVLGNAGPSVDYTTKGSMKDASYGYTCGGGPNPPAPAYGDVIQRFAFTDPGGTGSSDIGELTANKGYIASTTNKTNGQIYGGVSPPGVSIDQIDRIPLSAAPSNSADTSAELAANLQGAVGISDLTNSKGWVCGGKIEPGTTRVDTIYQFAADVSTGNGTDWGNLQQAKWLSGASTNGTHGFICGGETAPTSINEIDTFPFSSPGNATDIGNLTESVRNLATHASPTEIFRTCGARYGLPVVDTIDKFPTSATGDATDSGGELAYTNSLHYGTENVG